MRINRIELLKKGWSAQEVEQATAIIEDAEYKKHNTIKFLDKSVYWVLLFVLIVANALCSIFILPFVFVFRNFFVVVITAIVGLIFGILFNILTVDINKIENRKPYNFLPTLVLSGVINFGLMILFASEFATRTHLEVVNNIYAVGIVYFLAFVMPQIVYMIRERIHQKGNTII